ncbi:hypothetical protein LG047_16515 [Methylocystis sp. WRRC1]|uniref:hypothetical protein n=1 Tax=Methylocystis sp. WRRC1 TaxID=1732014 RepID=UPI001D1569E4|nr:hypothetical protein [Methylocystis sp. WRRC1]MCC3246899.1 hypothetical protein [Methylocystis sp. WRRC1]
MKTMCNWFFWGFLALACLSHSELALAEFSQCAWPIELSPEGYGNVVAPDDQARYWLMPFDKNYRTMRIEGSYPNARYFSFVVYSGKEKGEPVSVAGHKYDDILTPDAGNASTYTLCVARGNAKCPKGVPNTITHVDTNPAWVALRIYVPSADKTLSGQALMGGHPLPKITLNESQTLETCPLTKEAPKPNPPPPTWPYYYVKSVNKLNDLRAFLDLVFPPKLDIYTPSDYYERASNPLWFAAPKEPPILLLPNPDNKYIAMQPGPYQRGRIIVIHGKAPSFPDTYYGSPKSSGRSRNPDVRYWSVCNNDLALPVPAVRCMDDQAAVTQGGYYTVVISDDLLRPNWLKPDVNWLPWGDEQYPKLVFFRNLIPKVGEENKPVPFKFAIQNVVVGCPSNCAHPDAVIDFNLPYVPPRAAFNAVGRNVQAIMGHYYPVAVWCDKSTFEHGGWQACIKRQ